MLSSCESTWHACSIRSALSCGHGSLRNDENAHTTSHTRSTIVIDAHDSSRECVTRVTRVMRSWHMAACIYSCGRDSRIVRTRRHAKEWLPVTVARRMQHTSLRSPTSRLALGAPSRCMHQLALTGRSSATRKRLLTRAGEDAAFNEHDSSDVNRAPRKAFHAYAQDVAFKTQAHQHVIHGRVTCAEPKRTDGWSNSTVGARSTHASFCWRRELRPTDTSLSGGARGGGTFPTSSSATRSMARQRGV
jgi:hypothetical protein